MSNSAHIWYRVPDGSTLEFGVRPKGSGVLAAAALVVNGQETEYGGELIPGPVQVSLRSPDIYVVRLWVKFTGDKKAGPDGKKPASAEIYGKVVKPGGGGTATSREDYSYTVTGFNNQVRRATIVVLTLKS